MATKDKTAPAEPAFETEAGQISETSPPQDAPADIPAETPAEVPQVDPSLVPQVDPVVLGTWRNQALADVQAPATNEGWTFVAASTDDAGNFVYIRASEEQAYDLLLMLGHALAEHRGMVADTTQNG